MFKDDIASMLSNNYSPTLDEMHVLESDAAAHDSHALQLELEAESLRYKAAYLRHLAVQKRSLNAPVRRLPPEILGHIFVLCRDMEMKAGDADDIDDDGDGLFQINPSYSPLLQTHVCRHWRNVAHGDPLLWNEIHIMRETLALVQYQCIVSRFIHYSRSLPLTLVILDAARYRRPDKDLSPHTWSAIFARCRRVVLWMPQDSIEAVFPANSRTRMPLLEDFRSMAYEGLGVIDAPLLKRFDIRNGETPVLQPTQLIPSSLSSLTKLHLYDAVINASDVEGILSSFPSLEDCLFNNVHWAGPLPTEPLASKTLHTLTIRWRIEVEKYITPLLYRIDFPSLRSLHLAAIDGKSALSLPDEVMALAGWDLTMRNLTKLRFHQILLPGSRFGTAVLPRFHNLEEFEYLDCNISDDVISTLGARVDKTRKFQYCPKLKRLAVSLERWHQPLVNLVMQRVRVGGLTRGEFRGTYNLPNEYFKQVSALVAKHPELSMPEWD